MDEIPHVKRILEQELSEFDDYLKSLEMLPIIADIRQQAEAIRLAELEKTLRRMPDLTDAEHERIEALPTQACENTGSPHAVCAGSACPHAPAFATVARTLFELKPETGTCGSPETCLISAAAD